MSSIGEPIRLRIRFEPLGNGARLRWEADVLGVRTSTLPPPLPAPLLGLALRALDVIQDPAYPHARNTAQERQFAFAPNERTSLTSLGLWSAEQRVPADTPQRLGRRLFGALTADPEGARALGTVRDHAAALAAPLHLELCFPPTATALAALPWELLWGEGPTPLLLANNTASELSRRLDLPQALPPPRRASGPLRILALAPRAGIAPELRQVERAARDAAWGPLLAAGHAVLEELEPVDLAAVLRAAAAAPPDIIHFYGHGRLRNGQGALLFDAAPGASWASAGALAAALSGAALVVLLACQGATIDANAQAGQSMIGGVAQALCAAGVPAIIGMQCTLRVTAATTATAAIYAGLAQGQSVQAAVAAARRALFVAEPDMASWFVPALYLRERVGGPFYLRLATFHQPPTAVPPPTAPGAASQAVIARGGGQIRALRLQGRAGSAQHVLAESGGSISDVRIRAS